MDTNVDVEKLLKEENKEAVYLIANYIKELDVLQNQLDITKVCWKEEMTDRMEKEKEVIALKDALQKAIEKCDEKLHIYLNLGIGDKHDAVTEIKQFLISLQSKV